MALDTALPGHAADALASQLDDPDRARWLAILLTGEYRTAAELARATGSASVPCLAQLRLWQQRGWVRDRQQGPHHYFALSDASVAGRLRGAGLAVVADAVAGRWNRPRARQLRRARSCWRHLAGELGVAQLQALQRRGGLREVPHGFVLTPSGRAWLQSAGLPWAAGDQPVGRRCLDWSERRDHLAGPLATALLAHYLHRGWLREGSPRRALQLTADGRRHLLPLLACE